MAAKVKVDDKIVEAFENWIKEDFPNLKDPLKKNSSGNYDVRTTKIKFLAFIKGYEIAKS